MSIRLKLLIGCLALTLVTIGLGGIAQYSQREIGGLATRIYDEALLSMSYLRSAQNSLVEAEGRSLLAIRTGVDADGAFPSPARQTLMRVLPDILADLQVAADRAISPAAKDKIGDMRAHLEEIGDPAQAIDDDELMIRLAAIDKAFDTAVEIFAGDGYRFRREVGNLIDGAVERTGIALLGAIAIALAISALLSQTIVPPLNRAVGIARSIAEGRLDNAISPRGRSETAELLGALSVMQRSISDQLRRINALMASQASRYDEHIALQNARFEAALNNMSQGLCMFDENERLVVFNRRFAQMFGALRLGAPASQVLIEPRLRDLLAPGRNASVTRELPDGRVIAMSHQQIEGGGWVDTFEDITERRRTEVKLNHMALHDALTGLPNRVQFRERLETALKKPAAKRNLAILCLDLDGFKSVNDTLGHPVGDRLLKAAADRLLASVGDEDMVARLGGDEFAIIQLSDDSGAAAETLAKEIIAALGRPFFLDEQPVSVGVSVGIILPGDEGSGGSELDVDKLIKNGDLALYRAKSEGRSTYRFFEAAMDEQLQARRRMELDLRAAVDQEELELFYQPFVDVVRGEVSGFEALMRWRHPEHGFVSPAVFIPIAEEFGLIQRLGAWALAHACRQAASWPGDLKVAVNLSPVQFKNRFLIDDVREALAASGLPPHRLQLEVTESLLLHDTDAVLATLNGFRALGIGISMDDFGTGYSSLGYISKFPFSKIKIDQSFIRRIESNDSRAIVRAVIGLSRALDMEVIAEGVETQEQLEALLGEGCSEVQGYYFSKPRPANELASVLLEVSTALSRSAGLAPSTNLARRTPPAAGHEPEEPEAVRPIRAAG